MPKKIEVKIDGIHCRSCKTLIETEVSALSGVNKITVDHLKCTAKIEYNQGKISKEKIFKVIEKLNYTIARVDKSVKKKHAEKKIGLNPFWYGLAIPLTLALLIGGYLGLRSMGGFELLGELNEGNVSYGIILIIGLLSGFHCVGMCGGLVVAYSTSRLKKAEEQKRRFQPHMQYNLGRLISYSIIGAILGGIGAFFGINPNFTGTVLLIAAIFMVLMGLSFVGNWPILEKVKIATPQFIARFLFKQRHSKRPKGPFIVGLLNGFMPCGPLQAMQLYALTTGSVTRGALSMGVYALGTVPLLFGFGASLSAISKRHIGKLIKVSGVLVILLGLIMANRGLTNFGYGINFSSAENSSNLLANQQQEFQEINMDLTYLGYKPNVLYIKPEIPVRWKINVKQMTGCTDAIQIESLDIYKNLAYGENIIEFIPPVGAKEIKFSCWMRMVWGKFVINDTGQALSAQAARADSLALPKSGSCDGSCGGGCGGGCGCGSR